MSSVKTDYYAMKGMISELPPERQQAIEEAARQIKDLMAKGEDQLIGALLVIAEMAANS